ncbi:MAG: AMP-binding protein [Phyllobacterium sp.]|uniref:AMP-binding protein n=1 Tax=Phyllobacterium sp. TaxID=1871046 RepID=UPI0030F2F2FF
MSPVASFDGGDARLSHVRGLGEPPLLDQTISQALDNAAFRWGESDALVSVHQGMRLTYAQLKAKADAFAAGLIAFGMEPGDRIGIWSPNRAEWTVTQFAAARAGLILVNINPAYRLSELEFTLNKVGVKTLVAPERFKTSEYAEMVETLAPEIRSASGAISSARLPDLRHVIRIGEGSRDGWLAFDDVPGHAADTHRAALEARHQAIASEDAVNIQFTSGTTGLPKGATLSHRNILNNGFFVGRSVGLHPGDRLCIPVPLYHCFGMVMANLGCIAHGATMVYPSEGFDPLAVLQAIEAERCTGLYGVPTMFIAELGHPDFDTFDLSSLRTGCMAGSPCPIEIMKQVIERMHMRDVTIAYGMTETSPVSFQSSAEDPVSRRVSTIGRVQPHLECKIIDADGSTVPRGTPGELCTKGYSVMIGYWNDPEKTAEAIDEDGWMHTGDLATIDEEGYGNIVGRQKDMVVRGGENIYPREVEEYLFRHVKLKDVTVVGVPDLKYGEEFCAWIILKAGETGTEEEIRTFCQGQIAHYKVPRYVRFVEAFPLTVTGKIQKYLIRQKMADELGIEEQKTA